jgi:hypothetical protein
MPARRRGVSSMRDLVLYGNHESGQSYKVGLFLALAARCRGADSHSFW